MPNLGLQVHSALRLIVRDQKVTIVRAKCGFASTDDEAATRGGYRDLQLLVRCNGFDFNDIVGNCTNLRVSFPSVFAFKSVPFNSGGLTLRGGLIIGQAVQ